MASTYFNAFGPSYRGDTPVVGEIQGMTGSGYGGSGGDVFVMATIKNGNLFLPVRKINSALVPGNVPDSSYDGALLQVNDYAWSQSAISYYLRAAGANINIPTSDTFSSNYAVDFFKWKYQSGSNGGTSGIAFYAYQDAGGSLPVAVTIPGTTLSINYPTVSFNVVERDTNLCKINNPKTSDTTVIWYFQPRFSLTESTPVTFNSALGVPYPCCKNSGTSNCTNHTNPGCSTNTGSQCVLLNGQNPTYPSVFTAANPGIDQVISSTTKLYSGTLYDANMNASVYGLTDYNYGGKDNT